MRCFVICLLIAFSGCNLPANRQNLAGRRSFDMGAYNQALQSFQLALQSDPANADAHYNVGRTLHHLGKSAGNQQQLQLAEQAYRTALRMNPMHQPSHRGLAVLLAEGKRTNEAFASLQTWSKIQPQSAEPKIELARLYSEYGDKQAAIQVLSDALVVDHDNDRALRAIGALREESGEIHQAVYDYQRSLQINPMQPELASRLAQLQLKNGIAPLPISNTSRVASVPDFPRFN